MNQTPTAKREVAESSFDLLHHAIVDKISRNHPEKDLEMIGYTVGQKLVERYVKEKSVTSMACTRLIFFNRPIMENDLAVITFLCKDFWTEVYGKQMDKLRTNHKGVFELQVITDSVHCCEFQRCALTTLDQKDFSFVVTSYGLTAGQSSKFERGSEKVKVIVAVSHRAMRNDSWLVGCLGAGSYG
eukprot:768797-Hanusia_phi.AAC.4